MRFEGRMHKEGRYWAIEVPILGVVTQGRTRSDAYVMVADAIEALVNRSGFSVEVFPGEAGYFEVGSCEFAPLTALMLKRQRLMNGVTLAEAAKRLGSSSPNTYARYELGRTVSSVEQLGRLLVVVSLGSDLLIVTSRQKQVA